MLLFVALLQDIGKSNKATRNILFVKYSAYRRAVFIPQLVSYLLQGLALLAHGAGKFRLFVTLLVALLKQRKRHALARSLEVQRGREA